ncbi:glycolipid transfer protein domain-containing protein [Hyaloraphidium curvatum]|nr:glycolipid transfer protein domain-containing protein [Hyaloraphidium curvatum]
MSRLFNRSVVSPMCPCRWIDVPRTGRRRASSDVRSGGTAAQRVFSFPSLQNARRARLSASESLFGVYLTAALAAPFVAARARNGGHGAIDERSIKSQELADAAKLVGHLYDVLFASSSKLSSTLSADLNAHIDELLDYTDRNPHNLPADKRGELMLPVLEAEIALCGGKEAVAEGGTATSTWGLIWLLRILSFLQTFLGHLSKPLEFNSPRAACKSAYSATLGKHHSFVVGSLVKVAMTMVPGSREYICLQFGFPNEVQALKESAECSAEMSRVISFLKIWVNKNVGDLV